MSSSTVNIGYGYSAQADHLLNVGERITSQQTNLLLKSKSNSISYSNAKHLCTTKSSDLINNMTNANYTVQR